MSKWNLLNLNNILFGSGIYLTPFDGSKLTLTDVFFENVV